MIAIFDSADYPATRAEISAWLKKEADPDYEKLTDKRLAIFLNGLINVLRGKKEGPQPEPETRLTNNQIFMKLKIALNLKAEDLLEVLLLADFRLSKHELSAFFRKPGHKHYRECKEQVLRNFLHGLQIKHRSEEEGEVESEVEGEVEGEVEDEDETNSVWAKGKTRKR